MSAVEMPSPAALLSIREASQLLNLCEKSVWNHAAPRGTLPAVRLGSRLLFRREDIERWIESRVVRAESAESLALFLVSPNGKAPLRTGPMPTRKVSAMSNSNYRRKCRTNCQVAQSVSRTRFDHRNAGAS